MPPVRHSQAAFPLWRYADDLTQDSYDRIKSQAVRIVRRQKESGECTDKEDKKWIETAIIDDTRYLVRIILGFTWSSKHCEPSSKKSTAAPLTSEQQEVVRSLREKIRKGLADPEYRQAEGYATGMVADVIAIAKFCKVDLVDTPEHLRKPMRNSKPSKCASHPFALYKDVEAHTAMVFVKEYFRGIEMVRNPELFSKLPPSLSTPKDSAKQTAIRFKVSKRSASGKGPQNISSGSSSKVSAALVNPLGTEAQARHDTPSMAQGITSNAEIGRVMEEKF